MKRDYILSNRVYDVLKYVVQIFLPAFGALYYGLSGYWGLPKSEEVVGSTVVVAAFLGALLGLSSRSYNHSEAKYDGDFEIAENADENTVVGLSLNVPPEDILSKKEIIFKVKTP